MISKTSAERYAWADGCLGWRLLDRASLAVSEERMPKGTRERLPARARQFLYMLRGEARLEVAGASHTVRAGQGLEIPAGARHRIENPGPGDVEFLVVSQPDGGGNGKGA